jgi:hypothetical protein
VGEIELEDNVLVIRRIHARLTHAHTFKFITPAMTEKYKVPNPCTSCHTDKNTAWGNRCDASLERALSVAHGVAARGAISGVHGSRAKNILYTFCTETLLLMLLTTSMTLQNQ